MFMLWKVWKEKVKWLGFTKEDSTWEPLSVIHEDQPKITENFLLGQDSNLSKQALEYVKNAAFDKIPSSFLHVVPATSSLALGSDNA